MSYSCCQQHYAISAQNTVEPSPLNRHIYMYVQHVQYVCPTTADTCTYDIVDNSECPDCISVDVSTFKSPLQAIQYQLWSRLSLRNSE